MIKVPWANELSYKNGLQVYKIREWQLADASKAFAKKMFKKNPEQIEWPQNEEQAEIGYSCGFDLLDLSESEKQYLFKLINKEYEELKNKKGDSDNT